MNRTLQPLALIIGIGFVVGLRLLAGYDPLANAVNQLLRRGATPVVAAGDSQIKALTQRVEQLEGELQFKRASRFELMAANVINKTNASFRQLLKIDRGQKDGVRPNQAVLASGYLIGLVANAEDYSSTVILLGDPDLNVPVIATKADGIATAKAGGLVVSQLNDNGQAARGMVVTTSGLGGLYPPGLVVGSLGSRLSQDILSEFVLDRPFNLAQVEVVQIVSGP